MKPFDSSRLKTLDAGRLKQPWQPVYTDKRYGTAVDLDAGVRVTSRVTRTVDATRIGSMAAAIGSLPQPDEHLHLWIGGGSSMGHVIPAVLQLADSATLTELCIATLTFSRANVLEWADLIDQKKIGRLTLIASRYFEKTSGGIYEFGRDLLAARGADVFTLRSHCKILTMALSDGRTITAEGSANTRSAKTVEQVAIFGSPVVYQFHREQIVRARDLIGRETNSGRTSDGQ